MNCESKKYRRIVVKIGSNVLTREDGRPDTTRISALVDQFARLHRAGVGGHPRLVGRRGLGPQPARNPRRTHRHRFGPPALLGRRAGETAEPLLRPLQRIRHRLRAGAHHQGEPLHAAAVPQPAQLHGGDARGGRRPDRQRERHDLGHGADVHRQRRTFGSRGGDDGTPRRSSS